MNPGSTPKEKKRRHPIRTILAAAVAVYLVWLAVQAASFRKYASPSLPARAEITPVPTDRPSGQPAPVELRGAYHLHTRASDGGKTAEEVAEAAERVGLDFVILADHGSPNDASLAAAGKYGRVLVLAGTEMSSSRGHLVALGFDRPSRPFSRDADLAAREVESLRGFTVIAHPYSKTRWSWGEQEDFGGIEIINLDSDVRRGWAASLLSSPLLLVNPALALLKTLDPPTAALRKWDQLVKGGRSRTGRPVSGYYSVDAHRYYYETGLGLINLHVQLDSLLPGDFAEASRAIFNALRDGRFYCAVEAAADPAGFRFRLDESAAGGSVLRVRTPYPFAHETRLLRDGAVVASGSGPDLIYEAREPGAYRAEVYLRARTPLRGGVPWILANPILVRKDLP